MKHLKKFENFKDDGVVISDKKKYIHPVKPNTSSLSQSNININIFKDYPDTLLDINRNKLGSIITDNSYIFRCVCSVLSNIMTNERLINYMKNNEEFFKDILVIKNSMSTFGEQEYSISADISHTINIEYSNKFVDTISSVLSFNNNEKEMFLNCIKIFSSYNYFKSYSLDSNFNRLFFLSSIIDYLLWSNNKESEILFINCLKKSPNWNKFLSTFSKFTEIYSKYRVDFIQTSNARVRVNGYKLGVNIEVNFIEIDPSKRKNVEINKNKISNKNDSFLKKWLD